MHFFHLKTNKTPGYDDKPLLTNYRPISVLPCFSKILESMYGRLHIYLTKNKIFFNKQVGFKASHSTDHTFLKLVDHIYVRVLIKNIFQASLLTYRKLLIW